MKTKTKNLKTKNENQIQIIQVNPRFRLFLLIFSNWLMSLSFIVVGGGWASWAIRVPWFFEHMYVIWILFGCFVVTTFLFIYCFNHNGIKYLPKDLREHYLTKNKQQLEKINNLEINDVTQKFNVIPICDEAYEIKLNFEMRTKEEFIGISWIEETQNRLVVNGTIDNLDFSWGVVTRLKKNNFKVFLWSLLCYGLFGILFFGFFGSRIMNQDLSEVSRTTGLRKYNKIGGFDLLTNKAGKLNSENYLVFSAKLNNLSDLITLIPKNNPQQFSNLVDKYEWPSSLTEVQKKEFQNLIQELPFLPSVYLNQDRISIVMKKYRYNQRDHQELQTWELLKKEDSNHEVQLNYLTQATKIYQIFNSKGEKNEKTKTSF